jgi:CRISPR-associated protein Csm4
MSEVERQQLSEEHKMRLYKSTFKVCSVCASEWLADTVFGHLCWFIVRRDGEAALEEFLTSYANELPPILISDGFPADYLPSIQLPRGVPTSGSSKIERINHQRAEKEKGNMAWLTLDEFNQIRQDITARLSPDQKRPDPKTRSRMTAKNQIDRLTDTAGTGAGELYDIDELILPQITIYWRIEEGFLELVHDFLSDLKQTGYGKRKSIGYGQVESFTTELFDGFVDVPDANGFVTLSRFVPAPHDRMRLLLPRR